MGVSTTPPLKFTASKYLGIWLRSCVLVMPLERSRTAVLDIGRLPRA
jgi:hypothetical protein